MTYPWLKKNPLMSMWLSGFHAAANTTRGYASAAVQRQAATLFAEGMTQTMRFWAAVLSPSKPATKRRRRRRRR